jgi:predicted transposase/invertase (TIGR01784 family)
VENMVYGIERVIKKEKLDARMEGKLEGRMEKNIEIIRAMLIDGDSIDKIARITKLSVDEVEKIAKDITN